MFRIGIDPARSDVIEMVFAAVLADFGGYVANEHDCPPALQPEGSLAEMRLVDLRDS